MVAYCKSIIIILTVMSVFFLCSITLAMMIYIKVGFALYCHLHTASKSDQTIGHFGSISTYQIRYQLPAIHEEEPVTVIDYVWKKIRECNLIINPIKTHLMFLNQPKSDSWKLPHEVTKRHDQHFPQSLLGKMFHLANCHLFLLDWKYPYDMSAF